MIKSKFAALLGSLVLAVAAVLPVRAAEAPSQPYVVLVGISKYADRQILPRPHGEADIKALYDLFTNKDYLGVDKDHIRLLLGSKDETRPSELATHAKVLDALNWVADRARPNDLVIIAYIGQGAPLGERTCYLTVDSTFKGRKKNAISSSEIELALNKLKSERFAAFIDVNFKGFDSGKETAPELNLLGLYRELVGKEDAQGGYASRVVFLANSGTRPSLDLEHHGVFTHVLLEGLKGKADQTEVLVGKAKGRNVKPVYEPDGQVTVEELARYLRKEVLALVKKHAKTDDQKKQRAIALEGQSSDFTLTHNPAVMARVKKQLARIRELAAREAISREVAAQGAALIEHMPKLETQQALRKAFQKLADGTVEPGDFLTERSDILAKTRLSHEDAREYALAVIKATRLLKADYVKEVNQGQLVQWAVEGLFRRIEEKVPGNFAEKLAQARGMRETELRDLLTDVRTYLGKREDLDKGKDVTYTLNPMLGHLDKHTDYISPEVLEQMRIDTEGNFYGIGAHIRMHATREQLEIVTPILGSPAYKAKLHAGDIITTIIREVDSQGEPLDTPEVIPTKGISTEEAVKLIKGKAGTKVKLIVDRKGADKPLEFEITRGQVEVETVMGYKRKQKDDHWNFYIDRERKIAYVRLSQFARSTFRDLQRVMRNLAKQGINGMVLDLRFNPGGLLDSAVKVSDLFIDDGVIVTIKPRKGQETVYIGKHDGSYLDFPMVCLINDNSASGSEIVSACLQDHHRAVIMGDRSYGKGSVQTILPFSPTGGKLKMTNATFWRPNDKNLNKSSTPGREEDEWGVTPDEGYRLKIPLKEQDDLFDFQREQEIIKRPDRRGKPKPDFKDRQLEMALKYLRGQIRIGAKLGPPAKDAG
jgi:C-terminal peptidase prc